MNLDKVRSEFAMASRVRNDHCPAAYRVVTGDATYLELEYVPGDTLRKYAASQPGDSELYQAIANNILDALIYLDEHGYIHQDVTPSNVIVTPDGHAMLIDFGVAGALHATDFAGTPSFMAPEVLAGKLATPSSDVYSFAVTMIRSMLGRYPYAGDPLEKTDNRSELRPPSEDERQTWGPLGSAMLDVFYRAAAAEPAERLGSAEELQAEIAALRLLDDQAETDTEDAGDQAERPRMRAENPSVASLRGLYRASSLGNSGNRGLDDDFALATYVPTLLDTELLPSIVRGEKRLVLLTGNPGDGKTSFLFQVGRRAAAPAARRKSKRTRPAGGCSWTATRSSPSTTPASRTRGSPPTTSCTRPLTPRRVRTRRGGRCCSLSTTVGCCSSSRITRTCTRTNAGRSTAR